MPHLMSGPNAMKGATNKTGHKQINRVWHTWNGSGSVDDDTQYTPTTDEGHLALLAGEPVSDGGNDDPLTKYKGRGNQGNEEVGVWFTGLGGPDDKIGGVDVNGWPAYQRAYQHAVATLGLARNNDIEIISGTGDRAGYVTWQLKGTDRPADQSWTVYEAADGSVFMYDKEVGPTSRVPLVSASTVTPKGPGVETVKDDKGDPATITNADGSVTTFYTVTDASGRTSMQKVTIPGTRAAPKESDIVTFGDDGGRLIPLGDGKYTYEAPPDAPFTTGPEDVVQLPNQGGSLIKTSKNQYQFVRDTYTPGRKVDDSGREYLQQIDGSWTELAPRFQQGVVESGGREFLQQRTGALSELDPRYTPEVTEVDGMSLLQQRSGAISQLAKPNLDQIITQALVDGEYDKAFAFQDFRDRPSAAETFQTALEFARSPADQILISSIARGEQTVQPPPPGTIQRIGPQADFLVQAYQDFQRRTQAGRAPTEEEATTLSARAAAGASPLTDTLQARLEGLTRDQERRDEKHAIEIEGMKQSLFEQEKLFEVKLNTSMAALNTKLGLNADGSKPSVTVSTNGDDAVSTAGSDAASSTSASAAAPAAKPADKGAASNEEVQEAVDKEAAGERLTPEQIQHFQDFKDAQAAGFNPADYNNIASRAINAWKASVQAQEEQEEYETSVAGQLTDLGIPTEAGAVTNQAQFFDALGLGSKPAYQDVAKALQVDPDPQGTAAAAAQADAATAAAERAAAADLRSAQAAPMPTGFSTGGKSYTSFAELEKELGVKPRAGGGTVQPGEITVVGEQGPEIAMMPPGTHILPLGRATKQDIKAAQATGRAYQQGGIVFGELPFGIRQLQAGRPITPSRGYLSQAAGLTLPSAQALSNLTPESRDVYFDLARQAGIPSRAFGQELQTTMPAGRRLPTSRMLPFSSRGVR